MSYYNTLNYASASDNFCAIAEQFQTLTPAQSTALALKAQAGDKAASDQLVLGNLYLIGQVVAKAYRKLPMADLQQEGVVALYKAIETYDASKGTFHTHAKQWIRYYLQKATAEQGYACRISEEKLKHMQKMQHVISDYLHENEMEPSAEELAGMTGYSLQEVEELSSFTCHSLDENYSESADEFYNPFVQSIPDETEAPDAALCRQDIVEVIDRLTDAREAYIIRSFFGIDCQQKEVKELALELQLTEQRIRQIKAMGLAKLRTQKELMFECVA